MYLRQFFIEGLGHGSYLVGDEDAGVGAVIDPRRDFDAYVCAAQETGLSIQHVLETHTHNDYVSGAKELAAATGAQLWASGANGTAGLSYEYRPLTEGDLVQVGGLTLRTVETPGHTPEHIAYCVYEGDAAPDAAPVAIFSGGSLMVGGAGRTDLSGSDRTEALTHAQFEGLRHLLALPEGTLVYPTHGGGSFCGGGGGASRWSTVGIERRTNPLACFVEEGDGEGFARRLLDRLPVIPAYWPKMRPVNRAGPPPLAQIGVPGGDGVLPPKSLSPVEVRRLVQQDAVYVVDARDAAAFGGAHIPGAFGIGLGNSFGIWVGSVVPDDRPLVLVLPEETAGDARATAWSEAVRQLLRTGYDRIAGYLEGGLRQWAVEGYAFETVPQIGAAEALARLRDGRASLLDVRQPREWAGSHAEGAVHIPGASLPARTGELDKERSWILTCSTGYRSTIAASVLRRAGYARVTNLLGGMSAWNQGGLPVAR